MIDKANRCKGYNIKGKRCKKKIKGSSFCNFHYTFEEDKCTICNNECNPCSQICRSCAQFNFKCLISGYTPFK